MVLGLTLSQPVINQLFDCGESNDKDDNTITADTPIINDFFSFSKKLFIKCLLKNSAMNIGTYKHNYT